jgi:hypothetical protein
MKLDRDCRWWQPGDVAPFITPQAYQFLQAMHDAKFAVFTAPAGMVGAMTDLRCVGIINRGMGRRWEVFFNEGHEQVGALFTTSLANAPLAAVSWLEGSEIEEAMRQLE